MIKNKENDQNHDLEEITPAMNVQNLWSGILFGVGLVAFFDEAVFHQLLHWHHFYDKSTTAAGLVSDGFFHAFSWFATIGSLFMFADLRRQKAFKPVKMVGRRAAWSGCFPIIRRNHSAQTDEIAPNSLSCRYSALRFNLEYRCCTNHHFRNYPHKTFKSQGKICKGESICLSIIKLIMIYTTPYITMSTYSS